ncbi:lectin like domain-containing protein [Sporosalibacterium faouarense]|uniref:lectin like domain-containing protein n=1 Tax=Sporosalibacterium faouarense TaxID=516123 RepID=UPI00192C5B4F|nr:lectin like domain-containing protein [Sporosalibacterium faouarense]
MKKLCLIFLSVLIVSSTINVFAVDNGVIVSTEEAKFSGVRYPSKYDLREEDRVTFVKAQGQLGTCWAVSSIAALESALKTKEGKEYDLSEINLSTQLSNAYEVSFNRSPAGGGDDPIAVGYFASWRGPVLESDDPYPENGMEKNIEIRTGKKPIKHIQEVIFLPDRKDPLDNDLIKEHVMKYGAISVSMWKGTDQTFGRFYNEKEFAWYYPHDYMNNEGNGHAVDIVGWDDNYPKENFKITPPGDGAFIVKNTKGPLWGQPDRKENMGGYFYISYYDGMIGDKLDGNIGSAVFTRIDETDNYDNIYQYDLLGYTKSLKDTSDNREVWFSNVFDINKGKNEELSAVSFYTLDENLNYEIWINTKFSGKSSLNNMKKIKSGKIRLPGYHTIDLDKIVNLYDSEKVAVSIKLTSDKISPSIALESPNGVISNTAIAEKGQSYIKKNSHSSWTDIQGYEKNSNVCLKIFTDNRASSEDKLLSVEAMKEDVDFIVDWILSHQPVARVEGYTPQQEEIIENVYNKINKPMTEDDFYLIINRLFTMMGDGHTKLSYHSENSKFLNLPFVWLEEGLIVNQSTNRYIVGDKILSIGGKTPEELSNILYEQVSSENDYWIRAEASDVLIEDQYLKYFELINDDNTVDIEIERNGKIIIFKESFSKKRGFSDEYRDWVSWHIEKENNLGYFQFDKWAMDEDMFKEIQNNMDEFFNEVAENNIENIVFDIRENPGGTAGTLNYLFRFLDVGTVYGSEYREYGRINYFPKADESLIFDGDIYFMLSNRSFSCSVFATTILNDNGIVKVIGEPSGENPAFNKHGSGSDGSLPNTGWKFMMTSSKSQRPRDEDESEDAIYPDIPVYTTRDEIITGRDIQMERMREIARSEDWIYTEETIELDEDDVINITQGNKFFIEQGTDINITLDFDKISKENIWLEDTINHEKIKIQIKSTSNGLVLEIPNDLEKGMTYHLVIPSGNVTYATLLTMKSEIEKASSFSLIGNYLKDIYKPWNALQISFTEEIKNIKDVNKIELIDEQGKKVRINRTEVVGADEKKILVIEPSIHLKKGKEYTLSIPGDVIESIDGEKYSKEITVTFTVK